MNILIKRYGITLLKVAFNAILVKVIHDMTEHFKSENAKEKTAIVQ